MWGLMEDAGVLGLGALGKRSMAGFFVGMGLCRLDALALGDTGDCVGGFLPAAFDFAILRLVAFGAFFLVAHFFERDRRVAGLALVIAERRPSALYMPRFFSVGGRCPADRTVVFSSGRRAPS